MGNDSIVVEASEVVQDTSALSQMNESLKYFTTTPLSEWVPELVRTYVVPLALKIIAAILVFHEQVNWVQWIGVFLVMTGCVLIAR